MAVTACDTLTILYFSGYIRNYEQLSRELDIPLGLDRAAREQAILTEGFARWGVGITEHLCGAFAGAIRDEHTGCTYLFRDPVGQKMLWYAVIGGELLCSGDIDAIASDPRYTKKLNRRMLQLYLFYGYPIGTETFYEGIFKLPPGSVAEFDGSELSVHRYFTPDFEPDYSKSADEWADEIARVVDEILGEERRDPACPA